MVQICGANSASNESICGANSDGVPVEVNDSMPLQDDYEFVEDQNITSEQFDLPEENVIRPYSLGDGRHNGSDFALGQHFESKEALNLKLSLVAINGKFEMKTHRSTKILKEVRCVDHKCLWQLPARKMPSSNFFVIHQCNGFHSCTLINRSIQHRQASSRVIGAKMQGHFKDIKQIPTTKVPMGYVRE